MPLIEFQLNSIAGSTQVLLVHHSASCSSYTVIYGHLLARNKDGGLFVSSNKLSDIFILCPTDTDRFICSKFLESFKNKNIKLMDVITSCGGESHRWITCSGISSFLKETLITSVPPHGCQVNQAVYAIYGAETGGWGGREEIFLPPQQQITDAVSTSLLFNVGTREGWMGKVLTLVHMHQHSSHKVWLLMKSMLSPR